MCAGGATSAWLKKAGPVGVSGDMNTVSAFSSCSLLTNFLEGEGVSKKGQYLAMGSDTDTGVTGVTVNTANTVQGSRSFKFIPYCNRVQGLKAHIERLHAKTAFGAWSGFHDSDF